MKDASVLFRVRLLRLQELLFRALNFIWLSRTRIFPSPCHCQPCFCEGLNAPLQFVNGAMKISASS
jgi:hypothetical protein